MDLLKKFMGLDGRKDDDDDNRKKKATLKDEFRKPIWVEEDDSDDELFDNRKLYGMQMFTNPFEMQKHFEQQMQDMWKSFEEFDETGRAFDRDMKLDFLKAGYDEPTRHADKQMKPQNSDLDGEIYADQLHTLLHRITPELKDMLPMQRNEFIANGPNRAPAGNRKLTDEQKVMNLIHGITEHKGQSSGSIAKPMKRNDTGMSQRLHEGGMFRGPRIFGQSIISQTIRRPDGSYETRRTVRDSEGNTETTVTLAMADGRKETVTTYDEGGSFGGQDQRAVGPAPGGSLFGMKKGGGGGRLDGPIGALLAMDGLFGLNSNGYVLPKNLW
ncbi:uncharacterized protein LOC128722498 [Anopheles nili]|uniref:uncharacterized protein LOC128722498 n=1 Tax=Anopheles nili TaxID=185578 RepID=UPI00237BE440|nr:uncharacterized protein LOC128722498 [Anopheles nili]